MIKLKKNITRIVENCSNHSEFLLKQNWLKTIVKMFKIRKFVQKLFHKILLKSLGTALENPKN